MFALFVVSLGSFKPSLASADRQSVKKITVYGSDLIVFDSVKVASIDSKGISHIGTTDEENEAKTYIERIFTEATYTFYSDKESTFELLLSVEKEDPITIKGKWSFNNKDEFAEFSVDNKNEVVYPRYEVSGIFDPKNMFAVLDFTTITVNDDNSGSGISATFAQQVTLKKTNDSSRDDK